MSEPMTEVHKHLASVSQKMSCLMQDYIRHVCIDATTSPRLANVSSPLSIKITLYPLPPEEAVFALLISPSRRVMPAELAFGQYTLVVERYPGSVPPEY